MPKVDLREKVASVRSKAGLAGTDFLATWRQVNVRVRSLKVLSLYSYCSRQVKAQEISLAENGPISLVKGAKTLSPITKLKEHYAEPKDGEDEKARLKIVDALEVEGAAAWIVHTAIKANYDKHVRSVLALLFSIRPTL